MLFIIPGVLLACWLFASQAIYINEGLTGYHALQKSKAYTKGRVLAIFGRMLLLGLLLMIVSFVMNLIPVLNIVGGLISQFIFSSLFVIFSYYLYLDLKSSRTNAEVKPTDSTKSLKILTILGILLPIIGAAAMIAISIPLAKNQAKFKTTPDYQDLYDQLNSNDPAREYLTPELQEQILDISPEPIY